MPQSKVSYKVTLQVPGGNCACHQLYVSWCLGANWSVVDCSQRAAVVLSLLHWTSCLLGGVYFYVNTDEKPKGPREIYPSSPASIKSKPTIIKKKLNYIKFLLS